MSIVTRTLPVSFNLSRFVSFNRQRYPYALISSASPSARDSTPPETVLDASSGQYDIVFACPQDSLCLDAEKNLFYRDAQGKCLHTVHLKTKPCGVDAGEGNSSSVFFEELQKVFQQHTAGSPGVDKSSIPFYGGWFVYLSYEMAQEIEPCLSLPSADSAMPLAVATRIPAAIIHDRHNDTNYMVAESGFEYLLDVIEADSLLIQQQGQAIRTNTAIALQQLAEADEEPYLSQVERIKQYIYDGDIFQANLSRLWQATLAETTDDVDLFEQLALQNPSSFAALAVFEEGSIISSSPERLVSMRDRFIETRPIAGTRPRSADAEQDANMAEELLSHPKEQAEHIMLIDLERNDLGRVCVPGSIHVNELMVLESWQHVHHIVSNIRGKCQADKSSIDVLKAVFPGGTITGCPKVRCMEILAEQEQQARGAYTGSLGYINLDGDMDFNILIRTLVREQDKIYFRAGGGIVADSSPLHELEETRAKARGLLKVFKSVGQTND